MVCPKRLKHNYFSNFKYDLLKLNYFSSKSLKRNYFEADHYFYEIRHFPHLHSMNKMRLPKEMCIGGILNSYYVFFWGGSHGFAVGPPLEKNMEKCTKMTTFWRVKAEIPMAFRQKADPNSDPF